MTINDFSTKIALPLKYLKRLSKYADKMYKVYYIPKNSGQSRQIESPNQELKGIQRWILENILNQVELIDCITGFRKKSDIKKNAIIHKDYKYIVCMDLKDFFPSISIKMIYDEFTNYCDPICSELLALLCTYKSRLPQGAVTSPCLSNCIFQKYDIEIDKICKSKRVQYTRYADDLTISSNNKTRVLEVKEIITKIIESSDFSLNLKKTRIMTGRKAMTITGINVNNNSLSIGRKRKKILRAELHHLIVKKEVMNENKIMGMISFLRYIEPKKYQSIKKYIQKLKCLKTDMM